MNFLVMGSGAREHIIGEKLSQAGATVFSIITNSNPGLISLSEKVLSVNSFVSEKNKIIDFTKEKIIKVVTTSN